MNPGMLKHRIAFLQKSETVRDELAVRCQQCILKLLNCGQLKVNVLLQGVS